MPKDVNELLKILQELYSYNGARYQCVCMCVYMHIHTHTHTMMTTNPPSLPSPLSPPSSEVNCDCNQYYQGLLHILNRGKMWNKYKILLRKPPEKLENR
jgi:hypothetical protein